MVKCILVSLLLFSLIHFDNGASIDADSTNDGNILIIPRGYTRQQYLKSIVDFWTPERMASAIPLHPTINGNQVVWPSAAENIQPERLLTQDTKPLDVRSTIPRAAGRAFFVMDGLTYVCSGSVVNAANRDLIITAGHCVYNTTSKKYATNWVFVPHYDSGERPAGTFVWRVMKASDAWEKGVDYNNDCAVVLVNQNENGKHVQELAGSFTLRLNAEKRAPIHAFGYPMNINNGETMSNCADTSKNPSLLLMSNFKGLQIQCGMGGGASGGPWVQNYNSADHSGYQVSLTSFSYTFAPGKIHGPHFTDDNIGVLYNKYKNL